MVMHDESTRDSVIVDRLDAQIIRAIQISPRVAFAHVGEVLDVAEQTVARRYRRLRREGLLRVTLAVDPRAVGSTVWTVRVRCHPRDAGAIADALGRRDDVSWVSIHSAGWEVAFSLRAVADSVTDELLTRLLPRTASVLGVSASAIMHTFAGGASTDWQGWDDALDADQAAAFAATASVTDESGPGASDLTPDDQVLIEQLAHDGRTPYATLARLVGSTPGKITRRLDALLASGVVYFDVDLAPAAIGRPVSATLWLTVAPRHLRTAGELLARHPDVPFVAAVTGSSNLTATLMGTGVDDFYAFITTTLAEIDGITGYELVLLTRRIKHSGALVAGDRLAPPAAPSRRRRVSGRSEQQADD